MTKRNVVHIEIPSSNQTQSAKFYGDLFGWKITSVPELEYTLWEPLEPPGGGFTPVGPEAKVGEMLIHIHSDDIDADLARVKQLGGAVVREKTEITNIGWYAVIKDPTGNSVALFTEKPMPPGGA